MASIESADAATGLIEMVSKYGNIEGGTLFVPRLPLQAISVGDPLF